MEKCPKYLDHLNKVEFEATARRKMRSSETESGGEIRIGNENLLVEHCNVISSTLDAFSQLFPACYACIIVDLV